MTTSQKRSISKSKRMDDKRLSALHHFLQSRLLKATENSTTPFEWELVNALKVEREENTALKEEVKQWSHRHKRDLADYNRVAGYFTQLVKQLRAIRNWNDLENLREKVIPETEGQRGCNHE